MIASRSRRGWSSRDGWRPVALAAALLLGVPALLVAHSALRSSVPESGAHLSDAPRVLRLTFTEAPALRTTVVRLLAPDSASVRLGPMRVDSANTVALDIQGALAAGVYTVRWQVVGADGHPIRGSYSFTIAQGATGLAAAANASASDSLAPAAHHDPVALPIGTGFDAGSPWYVAIRWIGFASLLMIIGAVAFRWIVIVLLARRDVAGRRGEFTTLALASAARLGLAAAALCLLAAAARLYTQSVALHGTTRALDRALILPLLGDTVWGLGWLLQAGGAMLAIAGFTLAHRRSRWGWTIAALAALVLSFTPALSGHAVATPSFTALAVLGDMLHVVGAGGWLGSLLVVMVAGSWATARLPSEDRAAAVADLVNAFSPGALVFAAVLVSTGVLASWLHLDSLPALWRSEYGRVLLLKLALFSLVAATGAYNWRRVRPALGASHGTTRLRRSATAELIIGGLVLVATAVLVATPIEVPAAP